MKATRMASENVRSDSCSQSLSTCLHTYTGRALEPPALDGANLYGAGAESSVTES
jgi:hypothetical protein